NKEEIIKALRFAKKNKLPFFILGGGSNTLISDEEFKGIVIKIQNSKFKIQNSKIITEAGVMLGKLVNTSLEKGLTGLEWAIGIPGTVGGTIYGNAGAFGKSIGDIVKSVEVFDLDNEEIKILKNKDCDFKYRESIFKKKKKLIILSAILKLKKENKEKIKKKINKYLNYRQKTQPLNFPSLGSIFKNY
ncbi:MAG: UDP-N-acetylmuramate dehydrogenase, partial [Patescibacteria group bacterium]